MLILQVGIFIVLAGITYQDFRYRGIYWWMFPILFILLVLNTLHASNVELMLSSALSSCFFLGIQLVLLMAYLSLKRGRIVNIFSGFFGLGDLLFLLSITVVFSFLNYLMFYMISLLIVISLSSFSVSKLQGKDYKIPLAGYQAIFLNILMMLQWQLPGIFLHADAFLSNFFVYGN